MLTIKGDLRTTAIWAVATNNLRDAGLKEIDGALDGRATIESVNGETSSPLPPFGDGSSQL